MTSQRPSEIEAKAQSARSRTAALEHELMEVLSILRASLKRPTLRWEELWQETSFDIPQPERPSDPEKLIKAPYPSPPDPRNYVPELTSFDKLLGSRGTKKSAEAAAKLEAAEAAWRDRCAEIDRMFNEAVAFRENPHREELNRYDEALAAWEAARNDHAATQSQQRNEFDKLRGDYKAGKGPAVEYFFAEVLGRSKYPESFPKHSRIGFDESSGVLVVDFDLPGESALPMVKEVQYIVSRDEFREIPLSEAWIRKTYDEALYQISLRTIHEVYAADGDQVLKSVVFNGWVQCVDVANVEGCECILSVRGNREEFLATNLAQVDPRAFFEKLGGIAHAPLSELKPVRPILMGNKRTADSSMG